MDKLKVDKEEMHKPVKHIVITGILLPTTESEIKDYQYRIGTKDGKNYLLSGPEFIFSAFKSDAVTLEGILIDDPQTAFPVLDIVNIKLIL